MSERYYRVTAEVTYTGEWFVRTDFAANPKEAAQFVRDNADIDEPENIKIAHRVIVNEREIWLTDEHGRGVLE